MTMELKHAILGLLSIRPMSGYDLNRAFAGSVAHFWHADQSQIYRALDRLTAAGAIETEVIAQDGRPDRKVHAPTELGRAELDAWLSGPVEVVRPKIPLLAQLFFVARLGAREAGRILDEYEVRVREELERLRAISVGDDDDVESTLRHATLSYGIAAAEAELAWLAATRDALARTEDR